MKHDSTLHVRPHAICSDAPKHHGRQLLLKQFLALCGYAGTVWAMFSLYAPPCRTWVVILTACAALMAAVFLDRIRRFSGVLRALCVLLTLCVPLIAAEKFFIGVQHLVNQYYRLAHRTEIAYFEIESDADPTICVTLVICCIVILLAFFFVQFTVRRPLFWLPTAVIVVLLEPGLYMGIALQPAAAIPVLAYCCGLLALRIAMRQSSVKIGRRTAIHCGMYMALLTALVYGITVLTSTCIGYSRSESDRIRRRNFAHMLQNIDLRDPTNMDALSTLFESQKDTQSSALGTKSTLETDDSPQLKVTFDTLPQHTVYLKSFTGCTYEDNTWTAQADESVEADTMQIESIIDDYQCAPQNFPFLFGCSIQPDASLIHCTITHETYSRRSYQPYASFSDKATFSNDTLWSSKNATSYDWIILEPSKPMLSLLEQSPLSQISYAIPDTEDSIIQQFFRALKIDTSEVLCSSRFSMIDAASDPEEICGKVIPAALFESLCYRNYAHAAYTMYPETEALIEVYNALTDSIAQQACSATSPLAQYDLLVSLREWIASQTEYSTAPGKTPGTRDFIAFFLLENQKGYCMHYATAGTILARYLGIAARYCEGYIIGADMLTSAEKIEDGYQITLTRAQSHAWCEFYIDGYGWMPFEMTPGYYSEANQSTPETSTVETDPTSTGQESHISATTIETIRTTAQTTTGTTASTNLSAHPSRVDFPITIAVICVISIGLVLTAGYLLHRKFTNRHAAHLSDTTDPRRAVLTAYHDTLFLLRLCGIPYHGELMLSYCDKVRSVLEEKNISSDAPIQIIMLALASDLGNHTPTLEEQRNAILALHEFTDAVLAVLPRSKRFWIRFKHGK